MSHRPPPRDPPFPHWLPTHTASMSPKLRHAPPTPTTMLSQKPDAPEREMSGFDANVLELKRKPAGRLRARQCGPVIIKDCRRVELSDI